MGAGALGPQDIICFSLHPDNEDILLRCMDVILFDFLF